MHQLRIFSKMELLFLLLTLTASESAVHEWGYHHGVGPNQWKNLFPTCDGKHQSPIDIKTGNIFKDWTLNEFDFRLIPETNNVKLELENNGHAVQVNLKDKGLKVFGGGLPGIYTVEQFHFHWGSEDSRGSEHEINGQHFAMEMHVVARSEVYPSVKDAMRHRNGLAVLGFLFEVGEANHKFDEIIDHLRDIRHKDDHVMLKTFSLTSLFPKTNCYYRYEGSLTTPPCYESVIWTIFKDRVFISENQLNQFRKLGRTHFKDSEDLINNYRDPQPINNRRVTTNCYQCMSTGAGGTFQNAGFHNIIEQLFSNMHKK